MSIQEPPLGIFQPKSSSIGCLSIPFPIFTPDLRDRQEFGCSELFSLYVLNSRKVNVNRVNNLSFLITECRALLELLFHDVIHNAQVSNLQRPIRHCDQFLSHSEKPAHIQYDLLNFSFRGNHQIIQIRHFFSFVVQYPLIQQRADS